MKPRLAVHDTTMHVETFTLIEGMSGLFAGGTLSEQDKDAVMKALQDIYWESKARNVEKYTPKKYKKTGTDAEE